MHLTFLRWRRRLQLDSLARLNIAMHRDIGYVCAALIIAYCLSGVALNHINDWNPDFVITKRTVTLPRTYAREEVTKSVIDSFGTLVGEASYKIYDFPTKDQVKIYYDNASLHVHLAGGEGHYERIARRPLIYEVNALHLNRLKGWKWVSDVFALVLITLSATGLFVLRGKYGMTGRGKWLVAAGLLPPLLGLLFFEMK
ncbi:MAG: PepSY-associated TM helix domain-containing protein [Nitrospiraceae bacterium]